MTAQRDSTLVINTAVTIALAGAASTLISCGRLISAAGSTGLIPLDSARAVAVAQQNVCGQPMPLTDTTCVVRDYRQVHGEYTVTLDRRPPAGNDRVVVTLLDNGTRIRVAQVDSTTHRPSR
jgi:hypothetical protein